MNKEAQKDISHECHEFARIITGHKNISVHSCLPRAISENLFHWGNSWPTGLSRVGEYQLTKQEMNENDIEKIKNHWVETSDDDFKTMNELFKSKSYNWALFVGHISLEKLLKALYVKLHGKHAPTIHNLYRLAELCKIDLTDEFSDWLDTTTSFNINARYDDYKKEFYDLCTREYTETWIDRIRELRQWIGQML